MFQLHQERDGFIRFAGERNYRLGEDVQSCGNSGNLQMWLRLRLHSLGHCDVICAAMGWVQNTISLDGCVHVVRLFNRLIYIVFFFLDTVGSAFFPCIDTADILVVEPFYTF